MSLKVPFSVMEEVEQVAHETLGDGPLGEKELVDLITEWKGVEVVRDESLHLAIASVKQGLVDKTASIFALMNCGDFVHLLISGLKCKAVEIKLDVMSILDLILKDGERQRPEVDKMIGSGLIPALITLLTSEVDAVCQQALELLRKSSSPVSAPNLKQASSLPHFRRSSIIPALIKLAERTENPEWLYKIAVIVQQICPLPITTLDLSVCLTGLFPMSAVHELVHLCGILLMRKQLTPLIGACASFAIGGVSSAEGSFGVIVSSGLLPPMADLLSSDDNSAKLSTLSALTTLLTAASSDEERLQFFRALRSSSGLKNFWRSVLYANTKPGEKGDEDKSMQKNFFGYVHCFMYEVSKAFKLRTVANPDLSEALIETGFVFSLVKCLSKEADFESQAPAILTLANIVRGAKKDKLKLEPILDAGLVPLLVEQLKNPDIQLRMMAPPILKDLLNLRPSIRDEFVALGGLQQVIRMLKSEQEDFFSIQGSVILLAQILDLEPNLPLEMWEGLPEGLKAVLADQVRYNAQDLDRAIELVDFVFTCVTSMATYYGDPGIELMMRGGLYEVFIRALSSGPGRDLVLVTKSLRAVVRIIIVKQEYRDSVMELGVLETFPGLLRNSSDELIRLVLFCLKIFLNGELSPGQIQTIVEMKPLLQAEKEKGLPIRMQAASVLLSNIEEMKSSE